MVAPDVSGLLERLRASFGERYTVERELGRGGMATVFLAHDVSQDRVVAIKVLHPELAPSLAATRFAREIGIAADLVHPHIVPLLDSGEVDGLPFYVMPYIEGESLGARLSRERPLSVEEAVRITREIADALSYAHSRGIVHRDIKPDNVLLRGDHVLVADFGIARAIEVANADRLTSSGLVIGTPAYMSPEQAVPEKSIDGRSDIYSLACVTYEMLTGHPPFLGTSGHEILKRHLVDPLPPIASARAGIPAAVQRAVERALAKTPADRYPTASAFAGALDATGWPAAEPLSLPAMRSRFRRRALGIGGAVLLLAMLGVILARRSVRDEAPADPGVVAVLPFRIAGDSSVQYLGEGIVDLLATKISAMEGPRALDARTVLSAWRRIIPRGRDPTMAETRAVARAVSATRYVLGEIVVTPRAMSLSARLLGRSGGEYAVAAVQGPPDSLFTLVDRLCVELLAANAGEPGRRLTELMSTSMPAVRSYLAGRAALRRGERDMAIRHFTTALETDSTFALAALGLASAGAWSLQAGLSEALRRGLLTGYRLRDRLAPRDRLLFEAYIPGSGPITSARQLAGWARAAVAAPESPEAQYEYGDRLYHSGAQLGIRNPMSAAAAAFAKALALDSAFVQARGHLIELAAGARDRGLLRTLLPQYAAAATEADAGGYVRWRAAIALDDTAELTRLRERVNSLGLSALVRIIGFGLIHGVGLADVDLAARELRRRIDVRVVGGETVVTLLTLRNWAANRGDAADVAVARRLLYDLEPLPPGASIAYLDADQVPVLDALFWSGDTVAAKQAYSRLLAATSRPTPRASGERARFFTSLCVALLWQEGRVSTARWSAALERLRAGAVASDSSAVHGGSPALCVAMLDAMNAIRDHPSRGRPLVAKLDSAMREAPYQFGVDFGNLVLARVQEALGDRAAALAAVRRRPYDWDTGPLYLTTFLREEGRLARLTGDVNGAAHAYGQQIGRAHV